MKKLSEIINEVSRNKKNRITADAIKGIQGKRSSIMNPIRTMGIISVDYPDADEINYDELSSSERQKLNRPQRKTMKEFLKQGHYVWKTVKGKYGNEEHTYMIFNIDLGVLQRLAKTYNQSSFIYVSINEDETADYKYYEKVDGFYKKTKEEHSIEINNPGDDLFTQISHDFKFTIPFTFEECRSKIETIICESKYADEAEIRIRRSLNAAPSIRYYNRQMLYGKNSEI